MLTSNHVDEHRASGTIHSNLETAGLVGSSLSRGGSGKYGCCQAHQLPLFAVTLIKYSYVWHLLYLQKINTDRVDGSDINHIWQMDKRAHENSLYQCRAVHSFMCRRAIKQVKEVQMTFQAITFGTLYQLISLYITGYDNLCTAFWQYDLCLQRVMCWL